MGTIESIFSQLGINQSFFYQFVIFIIFYLIINFTFFNKLHLILKKRVEKTTASESHSNDILKKSEELNEEYNKKIENTHVELQKFMTNKKETLIKNQNEKIKKEEAEKNLWVDELTKEFKVSIQNKKQKMIDEVDLLSNELVKKIIQ